jgi:signal transduction histidine kinase
MIEGISQITEEMATSMTEGPKEQKDSAEASAAAAKEAEEFRREEERREGVLKSRVAGAVCGKIGDWARRDGNAVLEAADRVVAAENPLASDEEQQLQTTYYGFEGLRMLVNGLEVAGQIMGEGTADGRFVEDFAHALRSPLTPMKGYIDLLRISRREPAPGEKPEELTKNQREFVFAIRRNLLTIRQEVLDMRDLADFGGFEGSSPDSPKGYEEGSAPEVDAGAVGSALSNALAQYRQAGSNIAFEGGYSVIGEVTDEASTHLHRAFEGLAADTGLYGEEEGTLLVSLDAGKREVVFLREVRETMDDGSSGLEAARDHVKRRGWLRERGVGIAEKGRASQGLGLKTAVAEAHLKFVGGRIERSVVDWNEAAKTNPKWGEVESETKQKKVLKTVVRFGPELEVEATTS